MRKFIKVSILSIIFCIGCAMSVFAYSTSVFQMDNDGVRRVYTDGSLLRNSWVCDITNANIWYVVNGNGELITSTFMRDRNGYCYMTEQGTSYPGRLVVSNTVFDRLTVQINSNHNGYFGSIINDKEMSTTIRNYGATDISNVNNCVYTYITYMDSYYPNCPSVGPGTYTPTKPTSGPGTNIPSAYYNPVIINKYAVLGDTVYNANNITIRYWGATHNTNGIQCDFNIRNTNWSDVTIEACDLLINGIPSNYYISTDLKQFTTTKPTSADIVVTIPMQTCYTNQISFRFRFRLYYHDHNGYLYTDYVHFKI